MRKIDTPSTLHEIFYIIIFLTIRDEPPVDPNQREIEREREREREREERERERESERERERDRRESYDIET
ncbi:hypothetical protein DPMN_079790 [Dreissena polymorpha]|uniref:Uncharacterized protein n=1 Tax=Dreissena polymorpha TaxID=45954 RepID=A0A9D3YV45_DREPO|nr:hypothetical protein DPMN_079790 [Dreissena polymorpha]